MTFFSTVNHFAATTLYIAKSPQISPSDLPFQLITSRTSLIMNYSHRDAPS